MVGPILQAGLSSAAGVNLAAAASLASWIGPKMAPAASSSLAPLDSIKTLAPTRVDLPYRWNKEYAIRWQPLRVGFAASSPPSGASALFGWMEPQAVVPVKAHVESWHNLRVQLGGYYFALALGGKGRRREVWDA